MEMKIPQFLAPEHWMKRVFCVTFSGFKSTVLLRVRFPQGLRLLCLLPFKVRPLPLLLPSHPVTLQEEENIHPGGEEGSGRDLTDISKEAPVDRYRWRARIERLLWQWANFFNFVRLFAILLAAPRLSCSKWNPQSSLRHRNLWAAACELVAVGSSSLTTREPGTLHWECGVLATGSPGKKTAAVITGNHCPLGYKVLNTLFISSCKLTPTGWV